MTYEGALRHAVQRGISIAEARLLLACAVGVSKQDIFLSPATLISDTQLALFETYITQRLQHQPIAKIIGTKEFYGLPFFTNQHTLDPRPDSETLIDAVKNSCTPTTIVDYGTGTGCLLLTLLTLFPKATGVGVDISPKAIDVARQNAVALGLEKRVTFHTGDFTSYPATAEVVISNPPYIAIDEEISTDAHYDPHLALYAADNGLACYKTLAAHLTRRKPRHIFLEIGATQKQAVCDIFAGFTMQRCYKDLANRNRILHFTP